MGKQFDEAVRLSSLCKAARRCRRGVRWKTSTEDFYRHSVTKCQKLRTEVLAGKYKISPYIKFQVFEPKTRDIMATRMRDRVLQQSLIDHGAYEELTRSNIYDNGACQNGKGTQFAIDRTVELLHRYYRREGTNEGYAIHLDAKRYFPSTPHSVSESVIRKKVSDPVMAGFLCDVIESYTDSRPAEEIEADPFGARGTGLGSPVSQLVQLAIPERIDHYAKERMRMKYYIRYNDDVILWHRDRETVRQAAEYLIAEAAKLGLTIVDKEGIYPIKRGIKFLQLRFLLTDTGKVVVRLPKDKLAQERKTLRGLKRKLDAGEIGMDRVEAHYQSWVSRPHKLKAYGAIRAMDKYYTQTFRRKPTYKFKEGDYVSIPEGPAPEGAAEKSGTDRTADQGTV